MLRDLLQLKFFGNALEAYCWFIGVILFGLLFQRIVSKLLTRVIFRIIKKYSTGVEFDKLLELLKRPLGIFILTITFYMAFQYLRVPLEWRMSAKESFEIKMSLYRLFQVAIVISVTWIILRLVDFFGLVVLYRAIATQSKADDQIIPFTKEAIKVLIVIFSIFFILGAVFELNIASLIAGLGIGGLAVALAAKETLENLLGSFAIFLDKPFIVGDLVQVGNVTGHVERIGFRSTRLRTLDKTFVTMPNKKMVEAELDNLTLRTCRRAKFNIGLSYETKQEQAETIVKAIQKFIDDHPKTTPDARVRLYAFGNNGLEIMVQYFVDSMDWDIYIDVREEVNYYIMNVVREHKVLFAAPTTTVNITLPQ